MARTIQAILCAAALACAAGASAQAYPAKPVRLIVAAAPGGTSDVIGRMLALRLGERLGQPFVAENRGGGAGSLAAVAVAGAAADGYTLMISNSQMIVQAAAFGSTAKLGYDPLKDFSPVALVAWGPVVLGVNSSFPAHSVSELIAVVKANPGKYAFASCGNGTPLHLAGELFNLNAKIDLAHIPYRGCAPAMVDAASGQVPIFFTVLNNALPFEKSGKVRLLGVASSKRLAGYPNLPTISEYDMPGFDASPWFGILGPAGMPKEIVASLAAAITAEASSADFVAKLRGMQMEPASATPAEFAEIMRAESARWSRVIREAHIKID
jgi:tripartite-type tricarboxylate transporter receptor subunit TctC